MPIKSTYLYIFCFSDSYRALELSHMILKPAMHIGRAINQSENIAWNRSDGKYLLHFESCLQNFE